MNILRARRLIGTLVALALAVSGLTLGASAAHASVPRSYHYLAASGSTVVMADDNARKYLVSRAGAPWQAFAATGVQLVEEGSAYSVVSGKIVITPLAGGAPRTVTLLDTYQAVTLFGVSGTKAVVEAVPSGGAIPEAAIVDLRTGAVTATSRDDVPMAATPSGVVWMDVLDSNDPEWPNLVVTLDRWGGGSDQRIYSTKSLQDIEVVGDEVRLLETNPSNGSLSLGRLALSTWTTTTKAIPMFEGTTSNQVGGTPTTPMIHLGSRAYVLVQDAWVSVTLPGSGKPVVQLTETDRPLISVGNAVHVVADSGALAPLVPTDYTDVDAGSKFYTEISWLAAEDIADGWADGSFRPTASMGRDAMAAFLYRLAGEPAFVPPVSATFQDVPVGSKFYKEIEWASAQGITSGWPDQTYRPTQPIGREAMAAFLYRLEGEPGFTAPARATFKDVPVGSKFYHEVEWMASTGITTGWPDGTYRPTQAVKREAMAAFLYRDVRKFGRPVG